MERWRRANETPLGPRDSAADSAAIDYEHRE